MSEREKRAKDDDNLAHWIKTRQMCPTCQAEIGSFAWTHCVKCKKPD